MAGPQSKKQSLKLFTLPVSIDGKKIPVTEIPIDEILADDDQSFKQKHQNQDKLAFFKSQNYVDKEVNLLKDVCGVYLFIVNEDFCFEQKYIDETEVYRKITGRYINTGYNIASPPSDVYFPDDGMLEKGKIFYIGKAESNIFARIKEHLTNSDFNGTRSLKLGLPLRSKVVQYLDCYIWQCISNNPKEIREMENKLHKNYHCYFGKQ